MIVTGRFGAVDGASQVTNWTIEQTSLDTPTANSFSRGGMTRDSSPKDWTGSFTCQGVVLPMERVLFNFVGYVGSEFEYGEKGVLLSGNAIVDSIAVTIDWSTNARVTTTINFSGNGELTKSTGIVTDVATPDIILPQDCSVSFNGKSVRCKSLTFTLNWQNQAYVDSGTNNWNERKNGILDWNGSLVMLDDNPEMSIHQEAPLVVNCGTNKVYTFNDAKVTGFSGLTVSPENGALIEQTVNVAMVSILANKTLGSITFPNNQAIFPPTSALGS